MPSQAAPSVESDARCHLSVHWAFRETLGKLRHGPKAFEILEMALMTLVASFCVTFNVVFEANLLSVTPVTSENLAYALITLSRHRLNETTSVQDLLARFVRWFVESEGNYLDVRINAQLTLRGRILARLISRGKTHWVELGDRFGPGELRAS
jgi:hypothetical protein